MATRHALLAVFCAGAMSCGDGLLDDGYRGERLFQFTGKVATTGGNPAYAALRSGVFWLPFDPTTLGPAYAERTPIEGLGTLPGLPPDAALVEQSSIAVQVEFPGDFEINIFAEPPPEARGGRDLLYGVVLLYDDADGNGRYDEGEMVGAATAQMVVYAEQALTAANPDNTTDRPLDPGYALIELPLDCGATAPVFELDETYDVRVGAGCAPETAAADCGAGGTCLLEDLDSPLPGGYCVLDIDAIPPDTDPPETMVEVETERDGVELIAYYKVCSKSASCREGYTCQNDICLPRQPPALILDPRTEIQDACREYHEVEVRERG